MTYSVELLLIRVDCDPVIADTNDAIARVEFRIIGLTRSATLRSDEAADHASQIASLTDEITPLQIRVNGLPAGEARTKAELQLRAKTRQREELQDEQLMQGARTVIRRQRELDTAQRELAGLQDCLAQVTARRAALPA